ncbi:hypothetical protein Pcinc_025411 [Petrolisthes cinctipes]|uniref:Uncharacterized protein n=1 Tax=Petrolisthes cinctipes TaxID=88211 RepID=A0AAE1KBZ6_PETCI|nr:hypothetical protein Pcinc_025411 [Petrolisthes cinctipes]
MSLCEGTDEGLSICSNHSLHRFLLTATYYQSVNAFRPSPFSYHFQAPSEPPLWPVQAHSSPPPLRGPWAMASPPDPRLLRLLQCFSVTVTVRWEGSVDHG